MAQEKVILRKSKDGSLFFIDGEPRGFWLASEQLAPRMADQRMLAGAYSGLFYYGGYLRRWFSMRGFVITQGDPEEVGADDPRVADYRAKTLADALTKLPTAKSGKKVK